MLVFAVAILLPAAQAGGQAAPTWSANLADSPDPVGTPNSISYTGTGTDSNGDNYYLTVCRTNAITAEAPGTCDSGQGLCTSGSTASGSQASCNYATTGSDIGSLAAYGFLCDTTSRCSASTSTSTTVQQGYPSWSVNLADTTDPITAGNSQTYTATGSDSQGDQYRMTVCKTNSISNGYPGTCTGTTLCTSAATNSGSQASCSYSTTSSDEGTLTAYAFLCDAGSSTCSASTSTTTTVNPLYGILNVSISAPPDITTVTRYVPFRLNATIVCSGTALAKCGTVYAYARYNGSSSSADTKMSTTPGASPMWVTAQGTSQELNGTQWMNVSFIVNTSVAGFANYELDVFFNSSYGNSNVPDNNTQDRTIITIDYPPTTSSPNIYPTILRDNGQALANATYSDTDSDTGSVIFRWYVNGINVYTQTVTSVSAGSVAQSTLSQNNYTTNDKVNVSVHANDGDQNSSILWSSVTTVSPPGVLYTQYDGATTDYDSLGDTAHVSRPVLEDTSYGRIEWAGTDINCSGADFDSYVTMSSNSISVDSSNLHPSLDSIANVSIYNLAYLKTPIVYQDGTLCADCTILSYAGGTFKFNVTGFSAYTSGANSNLTTWSETDYGFPYSGYYKFQDDKIFFYANYSNATSGKAINGSSAFCNITFDGNWNRMNFSSGKMLYEYNRSFAASGNYQYNVSCTALAVNHEQLNLTDMVSVTDFDIFKFWNGTFNTSERAAGLWNISVRAVASWFYPTQLLYARNFTLTSANTPPSIPVLLSPTFSNTSIIANPPALIWENSTDAEEDTLTYEVNFTSEDCPEVGYFQGITVSNYTHPSEIMLDCNYNWTVRAFDGQEYSDWSEIWNFTLNSAIILTMVNDSIDFGVMGINETKNTDEGYGPFVVQNDGNIVANITWISVNASIFTSIPGESEYFQFKVDNTTAEPRSFNYTNSTTSWTDLSIMSSQNKTAVSYLNYTDASDEAQIDIRVRVPLSEPSGARRATLYIIGQEI
jgi:hypothetical protein